MATLFPSSASAFSILRFLLDLDFATTGILASDFFLDFNLELISFFDLDFTDLSALTAAGLSLLFTAAAAFTLLVDAFLTGSFGAFLLGTTADTDLVCLALYFLPDSGTLLLHFTFNTSFTPLKRLLDTIILLLLRAFRSLTCLGFLETFLTAELLPTLDFLSSLSLDFLSLLLAPSFLAFNWAFSASFIFLFIRAISFSSSTTSLLSTSLFFFTTDLELVFLIIFDFLLIFFNGELFTLGLGEAATLDLVKADEFFCLLLYSFNLLDPFCLGSVLPFVAGFVIMQILYFS